MPSDLIYNKLGKVICNFMSLESILRFFLCHYKGENFIVHEMNPGESVKTSTFTSYATMGVLIKEFNNVCQSRAPLCLIDHGIVEIRDTLAHGRILSRDGEDAEVWYIYKFNAPTNGMATCTHKQELTVNWIQGILDLQVTSINKVLSAGKLCNLKMA